MKQEEKLLIQETQARMQRVPPETQGVKRNRKRWQPGGPYLTLESIMTSRAAYHALHSGASLPVWSKCSPVMCETHTGRKAIKRRLKALLWEFCADNQTLNTSCGERKCVPSLIGAGNLRQGVEHTTCHFSLKHTATSASNRQVSQFSKIFKSPLLTALLRMEAFWLLNRNMPMAL